MAIQLEKQLVQIENTEIERLSFNLISYFMEEEEYTMYSFQDKLLENFNHADYQIVMIYSEPLYNDVNLETLFEHLALLKKVLRHTFLALKPRILVLATNSQVPLHKIVTPKNVTIIDVPNLAAIQNHQDLTQIYSGLTTYNLNLSLEQITFKINQASIAYVKKVNQVFAKKHFIVSIGLTVLLLGMALIYYLSPSFYQHTLAPILFFNKTSFNIVHLYQLLTNSLSVQTLLTTILTTIVILNFGSLIERIYGSVRFLLICVFTLVLSNALLFAFTSQNMVSLGLPSLIYGLMGAFIYAFLVFRRLLALSVRKLMVVTGIALLMMVILFDLSFLAAQIGALFGGLTSAFVLGIPGARNSSLQNRLATFILTLVIICLSLLITLK